MAKQPTTAELSIQLRDLMIESRTTLERMQTLGRDVEEYKALCNKHRDDLSALRQECALIHQKLDDHVKRVDTWDNRRWGLILLMAGALLSLASGLIVALARK